MCTYLSMKRVSFTFAPQHAEGEATAVDAARARFLKSVNQHHQQQLIHLCSRWLQHTSTRPGYLRPTLICAEALQTPKLGRGARGPV